jgi:hypothetical protein
MAEKVRLVKTVQQKDQFVKVVQREFTTFVRPTDLESGDTVQELIRLYDKLYLEIPLTGPLSHTYLIEESSKLVQLTQGNEDIQPLLDEINELRQRLLLANQQLIELQTT